MASNPYQSPRIEPANPTDASTQEANRLVVIESIPFRTLVLIGGGLGFSGGLIVGGGLLLANIFLPAESNLSINIKGFKIEGLWAGLCHMIIWPCYVGFLFSVAATLGFVPFRWLWKLLGKFSLKVTSR